MTLQPPEGYGAEQSGAVESPEPINPAPVTSRQAPASSAPELQPDSPANAAGPRESSVEAAPTRPVSAPDVPPPARTLSAPPVGIDVVGGHSVRLRKAVALDRIASGYGYLNISWNQRAQGLDLVALQEGSAVTVRGHSIAVDLSQPLGRVLIGTGTRGTMPLRPSELVVTNGATQVTIPVLGGTSLGVWPRLTITRVDEFVVLRHELDPLSGVLSAVASAYGYDERTFVLANTT